MTNFEEFLREKHMAQYTGTDDNAPDDFDEWVSELTDWQLDALAEKYLKIIKLSEPH